MCGCGCVCVCVCGCGGVGVCGCVCVHNRRRHLICGCWRFVLESKGGSEKGDINSMVKSMFNSHEKCEYGKCWAGRRDKNLNVAIFSDSINLSNFA